MTQLSLPRPRQLISERELTDLIERLGDSLRARFQGRRCVMAPILTGAMRFASHLMERMHDVPLELEPVVIQSYAGVESTAVRLDLLRLDPRKLTGVDVLIVDDIYDTGQTLWKLIDCFAEYGANSITSAVMLKKQGRQRSEFSLPGGDPEFVGAEIPDEFVVGMGLDYRGFYRNLPYIGALGSADRRYVDKMLDGDA